MITRINVNGLWVDTETVGLDYESAREATPQWFAVSHGNGNNGVSHMYPDYFVRTCDPWHLAELATIAAFKPEYQRWAAEAIDVDGEADYCISAAIYNPPENETERDHSECDDGEDCQGCEMCEPDSDWCSANGAYHITEVFPVSAEDMEDSTAPEYDGLAACFGADFVAAHTA